MIIFIRLRRYRGLNRVEEIKKIFLASDGVQKARESVHHTFNLDPDEWSITDIYPVQDEVPPSQSPSQ